MSSCQTQFHLVGRVLGVDSSSKGKIKSLHLLNEEGTHRIKLSSSLRSQSLALDPGTWVSVRGTEKHKAKPNKIKLKAKQIQPHPGLRQLCKPGYGDPCPALDIQDIPSSVSQPEVSQPEVSQPEVSQPDTPPIKAPAGKILVCQKSKCRKRASGDLCKLLKQSLDEYGLGDSIQVQGTGCLKRCKSAPNLVVLPKKARHSNIKPQEIPALVEEHFG